MVRNLVRDNRVVYGGGAAEIACSIAVEDAAVKVRTLSLLGHMVTGLIKFTLCRALVLSSTLCAPSLMRWTRFLWPFPQNSGLSPIETLASIKSRQVKEKNSRLGVDCMLTGSNGKQLLVRDLVYVN